MTSRLHRSVKLLPITQIAEKAGIDDKYLEQYGKYKAKIDYNLLTESDKKDGKLILVQLSTRHLQEREKQQQPLVLQMQCRKMGKKEW